MLHTVYPHCIIGLFLCNVCMFSLLLGTSYGSLMGNISMDLETYCPNNDIGHPKLPQQGFFDEDVLLPCCDTCLTSQPCGLRKPCCPGVTSHVPNVTLSCKRINYYGEPDAPTPSLIYWMVTSCKPQFDGTDLEQQCHKKKMANFLDLASVRPVLDKNTGAIYPNVYCARCNGLSTTVDESFFSSQMVCTAHGMYEMVRATSMIFPGGFVPGLCFIRFLPTDSSLVDIGSCLARRQVNTCNVTRQWRKYDSYIEEACHAYQRPYVAMGRYYRNAHCYLCNIDKPPAVFNEICGEIKKESGLFGVFSFYALLDPNERGTVEKSSNCPPWAVFDSYKDACRNVSCPPLSVQTENGCTPSTHTFSTGLNLRLSLLWTEILPNATVNDVGMTKNTFQNDTEEMAKAVYDSFQNMFVALFPIESTHYACELTVYAGTNNIDGTWIVVSFVWTIKNATHSLIPDAALKFANDHSGYGRKMFINVRGEDRQFNVSITGKFWPVSYINIHSRRLDRVLRFVYDTCSDIEEHILYTDYLEVAKIQTCSVIELQEDEYERLQYGHIFVNASKTYLSEVEYIDAPLPLRVCVSDYIPQLVRVLPVVTVHKQVIAMMSFVCSMVSVACLFVTIASICVCPSLHTLPMKLCVCLSVTMFAAQTLQQFAIDQINLKEECVIFGVLIHFLWLKTLFWMNACSFHFFYLFALPTTHSRNCLTKHTVLVYFIYTSAASALIVVANICWAGIETGWEHIGYGGDICYISSPDRVLFTFTIPAAVILFSNAVFLISTIITLTRLDTPGEYSSVHRNYVKIFLKLSTLTGVYWVFGFLKIWTDLVVFEYLFTLFNASQGVFLMVSFVCNKEVLGWYSGKFLARFEKSTTDAKIN